MSSTRTITDLVTDGIRQYLGNRRPEIIPEEKFPELCNIVRSALATHGISTYEDEFLLVVAGGALNRLNYSYVEVNTGASTTTSRHFVDKIQIPHDYSRELSAGLNYSI